MTIINGGYREYKLNNGLVVALQNTPTQTIAAKLRVNYGATHEEKGEEGLAHFLEHCLVTGGSVRYSPIFADKIRSSFGDFNAATNIGRTFFPAQMLTEDLETWLDYVSDHVFRPRFDQERMDGERERVLREIADSKSSSTHSISQEFNELFYRGHPKGRYVLGNEQVIRNASIDSLRNFHARGYHPNNMDLIVVGGLPQNTPELIEKYFASEIKGKSTRRVFPKIVPLKGQTILHHFMPESRNLENPDESSAQLIMKWSIPPISGPDKAALRIMSHILGGNNANSFLFKKLGLKQGLAYSVGTSYDEGYNCGEFHLRATIPAVKIGQSLEAIFNEINRMKMHKVSGNTINRVRRLVQYNIAKTFESNEGHVSAIEAKLDEGLTPELLMQYYSAVTPERILNVSRKYLPDKDNGNYLLLIANPLKKESDFVLA